ncbi:MAG: hypothetical protein ACOWWM_21385 [Desulfobacterales bacterium]
MISSNPVPGTPKTIGSKTIPRGDVRACGLALILCLLLWSGGPSSALGYVPQGEHILDLAVRDLGAAKVLRVQQKATEFAQLQGQVVKPQTLTFGFPDRIRLDEGSGGEARTLIREAGRSAVFVGDAFISSDAATEDLYADIPGARRRDTLADALRRLGADVSVSSMGLHEGRVCYVVGAVYPDPEPVQLWVDHLTLRPYRLLLPGAGSGSSSSTIEFRYQGWTRTDALWYPHRISIWRGDFLWKEILAESIEVDPAVEESFFSIARKMAEAQAFRPPAPAAEETSLPSGTGADDTSANPPQPVVPPGRPTTP